MTPEILFMNEILYTNYCSVLFGWVYRQQWIKGRKELSGS